MKMKSFFNGVMMSVGSILYASAHVFMWASVFIILNDIVGGLVGGLSTNYVIIQSLCLVGVMMHAQIRFLTYYKGLGEK